MRRKWAEGRGKEDRVTAKCRLGGCFVESAAVIGEREALRRALAQGRPVIQVIPQRIPPESELQPALLAACRNGQALLLSPQPPGSRLNKKVATWCNEYVLRHADEIWAGDISPNGMLAAMLKSLGRWRTKTGR